MYFNSVHNKNYIVIFQFMVKSDKYFNIAVSACV